MASYETWFKFITQYGWAMSAVIDAGGMRSGVDALVNSEG